MKRPEGFDDTGKRDPTPPARDPKRSPLPGARAPRREPSAPDARKPAPPAPSKPTPTASRPTPPTTPAATSRPKATTPTAAPAGPPPNIAPPVDSAAPRTDKASAAAQRRTLRKAARARRRFEHAEVRRFTKRSRRRRATWLTVGGVVVALGSVLAIAVYSPLLALREITVDGTTRLNADDVRSAVDDQMGTPLALLDLGAIRDDLEAFPLIRSYVTETVPPNTLRIHIVEREPVGIVANGGAFDQVDPAGVVIASSPERPDLPLIEAGETGNSGAAFDSAVEVLLAMPDSVSTQVDTITARTADDVGLTLKGTAPRVVWGSADDSELKARTLAVMLARPECAPLPVIDVSAPLAPICGPN